MLPADIETFLFEMRGALRLLKNNVSNFVDNATPIEEDPMISKDFTNYLTTLATVKAAINHACSNLSYENLDISTKQCATAPDYFELPEDEIIY